MGYTIIREIIEKSSHDAFLCSLYEESEYICLDVASPSTLAGGLRGSNEDEFFEVSEITDDAILFGSSFTCDDKRVGDGVYNVLDLIVVLMNQYKIPPYNLPLTFSDIITTEGASSVQTRCGDGNRPGAYYQQYLRDACSAMSNAIYTPSRMLQESVPSRRMLQESAPSPPNMTSLGARVDMWSVLEGGSWFRVALPLVIAVELRVGGIEDFDDVPLSLEAAPVYHDAVPSNPKIPNVRFARHLEYVGEDTSHCALVQPLIDPATSAHRSTIGVGQMSGTPCAFDLFLWVPLSRGSCDLVVLAGSVAMDGLGGAIQSVDDEVCQNASRPTLPSASPIPLPPPPLPVTPPPIPLTPPPSPVTPPPTPHLPPATIPFKDELTVLLVTLLVAMTCCGCCILFLLRRLEKGRALLRRLRKRGARALITDRAGPVGTARRDRHTAAASNGKPKSATRARTTTTSNVQKNSRRQARSSTTDGRNKGHATQARADYTASRLQSVIVRPGDHRSVV